VFSKEDNKKGKKAIPKNTRPAKRYKAKAARPPKNRPVLLDTVINRKKKKGIKIKKQKRK